MAHPIYDLAVKRNRDAGNLDSHDAERIEQYERDIRGAGDQFGKGFTPRELRFAYECLCNGDDFKGPFVTTIHPSMLELATEAVRYFTNRALDVVGTDHQTGRLFISAPGFGR